jgi:hypothetical protein
MIHIVPQHLAIYGVYGHPTFLQMRDCHITHALSMIRFQLMTINKFNTLALTF